ncbi:hypothetical protein [Streptomyces mirabilis]|uniref:hypothetical protein n=1 Tax=Streptomyces mirabilis TaxID=68239 RepID=UPI0022518BF4|nr:hypothetical protein [Streptomyces mirabilis]MCX4612122.1 hypothetical protein [Streptomyces mirabilis]
MNATATQTENTTAEKKTPCECSRYSVLVNVREADNGDLTWDEELTTGCEAGARKQFAQGHDAKLKSFLIRAGAAGHEVCRDDGGVVVSGDAATHAQQYTFGHMVAAGIERAEAKAAKKAERLAAKEKAHKEALTRYAARQTRKIQAKLAKQAAEPKTVKAKVGRWMYEGTTSQGGSLFTYRDAKGNEKTAAKFQLA